ncbi:C69 family dipeptidase [Periweissella cryptocerci]|uniref:Dipeptidase n=1 Tax=Periweissella cryptocerci TaxID=2506420 RepID=A0A4P6YRD4_9LACO|nr:C69 family dipeptidase [Periweissella cryptocerci]QBO35197.1 C69 family dipeptidase [Periweissella cryptocerci]
MMDNTFNFKACTSILIGKDASIDGSTMIGRNEDSRAAWAKALVVRPHEEFLEPQTFVSKDNGFTMELPKVRGKYTATPEWTKEFGLFEEAGINEYGVAMSATESTYTNERALAVDPLETDGIGEEAMVTVVLPYVQSAREGVRRLGMIIEEYGTCESNGVLFSDREEVWYFESAGGHQWVAQRIPDDAYAVVANQMAIQEIDFDDADNFIYKSDLRDVVSQNHLNPNPETFNWRNIFGTHDLSDAYYNTPRVWYGQQMFNPEIAQVPASDDMPFIRKANRKISRLEAQQFLASHFEGTAFDPIGVGSEQEKRQFRPVSLAKTQESHILQIRPNMPTEVAGIHWIAQGVAAQSVYVPFYAGATTTPAEYQLATEKYHPQSAYWIFKLVGVLVDPHYLQFGRTLQDTQKKLNVILAANVARADCQARQLTGDTLIEYLTAQSNANAKLALAEYQKLAAELITTATDLSPLNFKQDMNL